MACAIMQQQLNLAEWVERKIFTSVRGRPKRPGYMQRAPVIASFSKHPLTMHTASRKNNAPSLFWTISRALLVLFSQNRVARFTVLCISITHVASDMLRRLNKKNLHKRYKK